MKSKVFRLLTTFLLLVLLVGSLSVTAFATGDDPSGDSEISEPEHHDNVLTPDGNMTIVDDIHGDADKQFIVFWVPACIYGGIPKEICCNYLQLRQHNRRGFLFRWVAPCFGWLSPADARCKRIFELYTRPPPASAFFYGLAASRFATGAHPP